MINITEFSGTDTVALYELLVGKASCEQNQEGLGVQHDRLYRTTTCGAEPISSVQTCGSAVVSVCNSQN